MISYLNAHKWSLINADQKGYILARYNLLFNVITTISKIIVLWLTNNYILYLLIEAGIFIIQNIWNGKIVNERYSYIKTTKKYKVDEPTKQNLTTNVKAIFLHNIGSYCVFGTDNLLISAFISLKAVGLYSNYTMVIGQLSALLTPAINGLGASIGHLIATESKDKTYDVFKVVNLVNFWIYSFSTIFLFNLLEPFINWWLGEGLLLGRLTFVVILVNFYIKGMRTPIGAFKDKAGLFSPDRFCPLYESAINLGASVILVKYLGLAGIFLGTTISSLLIPVWTQSKITYNMVFNKSVLIYFRSYLWFILLTLATGFITTLACHLVPWSGFFALVMKGIICVIIVNVVYLIVFFKTSEFKYLWQVFKPMIEKRITKYSVRR